MVLPSWRILLVLPWKSFGARMILPPKAAPMAWRDNDAFGLAANDFVNGDFVVAVHLQRAAKFAKILREIVSKGIVVIEQENERERLWPLGYRCPLLPLV